MDAINTAILFAAFANAGLAVLVALRSRDAETLRQHYVLLVASVTLWAAVTILSRMEQDLDAATLLARLRFVTAAFVPPQLIRFAAAFLDRKVSPRVGWSLLAANILAVAASAHPSGVVHGIEIIPGAEQQFFLGTIPHSLYATYVAVLTGIALWIFFRAWQRARGPLRTQAGIILVGTAPAVIASIVGQLLLPAFGYFELNWIGLTATILFSITVSYAVARHGLLNVRIITTEIFAALFLFVFATQILAETAFSGWTGWILQVAIFSASIALVLLLLRGINREIRLRQEATAAAEALRAANEKLRQLDDAKTEFLSIVSHQLRTPLTATKGFLSLMREGTYGALDLKQRGVIEKISLSNERLIRLVADLLDVSRMELRGIAVSTEPCDLRAVASSVIDELRPLAEKKNLRLLLEPSPRDLPRLRLDAERIRQAVVNIVANAIQYSDRGNVVLSLLARDGRVSLSVRDQGRGIAPEDRVRLFERFRRGMDVGATSEGTGLGLYIANQIVRAHGGHIEVRSGGRGKGSEFRIILPLQNDVEADGVKGDKK